MESCNTFAKYSGTYGVNTITFEKGKLFYQKSGKAKFQLLAITQNLMRIKGNEGFKVNFIKNELDQFYTLITLYNDGRIEHSYFLH